MIHKINNPIIRMTNPVAKKPIPIDSSLPLTDWVDFGVLLLMFSPCAAFAPEKWGIVIFVSLHDKCCENISFNIHKKISLKIRHLYASSTWNWHIHLISRNCVLRLQRLIPPWEFIDCQNFASWKHFSIGKCIYRWYIAVYITPIRYSTVCICWCSKSSA